MKNNSAIRKFQQITQITLRKVVAVPTMLLMGESLADLVKARREAAGLSQSALAKLIGSEARTIANLERGRTRIVKMKFRRALADALGIPMEQLNISERGFSTDLRVTIPPETADRIRAWAARTGSPDVQSAAVYLIGYSLGALEAVKATRSGSRPDSKSHKSVKKDRAARRKYRVGFEDGTEQMI